MRRRAGIPRIALEAGAGVGVGSGAEVETTETIGVSEASVSTELPFANFINKAPVSRRRLSRLIGVRELRLVIMGRRDDCVIGGANHSAVPV